MGSSRLPAEKTEGRGRRPNAGVLEGGGGEHTRGVGAFSPVDGVKRG